MSLVHLATTLVTTDDATPAFTPEAGDLIVVVVTLADTTRLGAGGPNVTDSAGGAYTPGSGNMALDDRYDPFRQHGAWHRIRNTAAPASSMTVTIDCVGVAQAGCTAAVLLIKNPLYYGADNSIADFMEAFALPALPRVSLGGQWIEPVGGNAVVPVIGRVSSSEDIQVLGAAGVKTNIPILDVRFTEWVV